MTSVIKLCLLAAVIQLAQGAGVSEWKNRTIYQLLTDRFATYQDRCNQGSCQYGNYCGGSYRALIDKLDYIQGMGFDAVWISPVVENTDCGYHGYWASDLYSLNQNFGSTQDLAALSSALHQRGMLLMVDVVYNHMGPTDEHQLQPFNDNSYYHDQCQIDYSSQQSIEQCWLANLPDLKQEDNRVSSVLVDWTSQLLHNYSVDGIRIDTTAYVPKQFFQALRKQSVQGTYTVGEVLISNKPLSYMAGYQQSDDSEAQGPVLDATLNYPLFFALRDAFMSRHGNGLSALQSLLDQEQSTFNDYQALGTFVDNHDQVRFLSQQQDLTLYKNAIAGCMFLPGVPIMYYGTEQAMAGGQSDNEKREPLWQHGGYSTSSEMYSFVSRVVGARRRMLEQAQLEQFRLILADDQNKLMAFSRGSAALVILSTAGNGGSTQNANLDASELPDGMQSEGTQLCDALAGSSACFQVSNGKLNAQINGGMPLVLFKKE